MKRDVFIDIAKGSAIMLVCAGHSCVASIAPINSWICSFHMAFFFLVAGYCYNPDKYKTYTGYVIRKVKALGYPYLMLSIFVGVVGFLIIPGQSASVILSTVLPYPGKYVIGFWFVRVLFFTELISAMCNFRYGRLSLGILSFLCVVLIGFDFIENTPEIFRPASIVMGIFFYHLGMAIRAFVKRFDTSVIMVMCARVCVSVCVALFVAQIAVLWLVGWPQFSFGGAVLHKLPLIFMFTSLSGSLVLLLSARIVEGIPVVRDCLAYLGRNSLCLLAVHPICGVARTAWLTQCPWMPVGVSYFAEIIVIGIFMYLISGPFRVLSRWSWD